MGYIYAACEKCGNRGVDMHYSETRDRLAYTCNQCGYTWYILPLDHDQTEE